MPAFFGRLFYKFLQKYTQSKIMATRNFNKINGGVFKVQFKAGGVLLSDDTATLDTSGFSKARIIASTTGFTTGNITVTPTYGVGDLEATVALGTPVPISANGNSEILAGEINIATVSNLKFTRGADTNPGAVSIYVILSR